MHTFKVVILALLVSSVTGCKKHAGCTKFGSENYDPEAIVEDGSCIAVRDKFLGTFQVYSNCTTSPYTMSVAEHSNENKVTISMLADTLNDVDAEVYGQNITIEEQSIGVGVTVEGAGISIHQDTVELSIRIRDFRGGTLVTRDCFERCFRQ